MLDVLGSKSCRSLVSGYLNWMGFSILILFFFQKTIDISPLFVGEGFHFEEDFSDDPINQAVGERLYEGAAGCRSAWRFLDL